MEHRPSKMDNEPVGSEPDWDDYREPWFVVGEAVFGLLIVGTAFYASLRALRLDRDDDQKPQS